MKQKLDVIQLIPRTKAAYINSILCYARNLLKKKRFKSVSARIYIHDLKDVLLVTLIFGFAWHMKSSLRAWRKRLKSLNTSPFLHFVPSFYSS